MADAPIALIVAGPTCSGKSALALGLAERFGGTIVNADSMQVYADLHVLTARPDAQDEARAPHRLYGVLDAAQPGSVAWWREAALAEMNAAWVQGRLPILCGGTGMYLRALLDGLVEVPEPGDAARDWARTLVETQGSEAAHALLMQDDPDTAQTLKPGDGQRVARALEVLRGTGHGLTYWRGQPGLPAAPCRFVSVRLHPPRDRLRASIAERFSRMMTLGAMQEVERLVARGLSPALPAMRAHGVPELSAVLAGTLALDEAMTRAVIATGQYTRRQATWFNHHALGAEQDCMISLQRYDEGTQFSEREFENIATFIQSAIDESSNPS
ncbi:tRNA (adenosine(37)-N6)-dimethylallyltransferase MiaA [Asaia lannensis]|uniref:tRNA dimethylallyltransferase n=1 Tax=Asaia lannensis NBRC 102526 TaxID=1307926 RepID=A0ABT1CD93_9PROT|nr:tRNA (adenosine(37)-N6)-dimethylallyltransferase MiaA [Asaia lannensis]MCO6158828.1 tRNA (adenosine(37)-N6)-dimethylallyltransferase MiaA [Asaia lannensis NBRC 102526]GBR00140.1 tRNA isopentenyltransferase [Asaia lannensis NBRC 102526]